MICNNNLKKLLHNGGIEFINGEKWRWGSDGPPLVDKMDKVEELAPLPLRPLWPPNSLGG